MMVRLGCPLATDFLMPVKALSKLFRAKFRDCPRQAQMKPLRKTEYFDRQFLLQSGLRRLGGAL